MHDIFLFRVHLSSILNYLEYTFQLEKQRKNSRIYITHKGVNKIKSIKYSL